MIAFQLDSLLKLDAFYDLSYNDLNQSFLNHFHQVTVPLSAVHLYWLSGIGQLGRGCSSSSIGSWLLLLTPGYIENVRQKVFCAKKIGGMERSCT